MGRRRGYRDRLWRMPARTESKVRVRIRVRVRNRIRIRVRVRGRNMGRNRGRVRNRGMSFLARGVLGHNCSCMWRVGSRCRSHGHQVVHADAAQP